jgi:nitrogen fixation protein NifB
MPQMTHCQQCRADAVGTLGGGCSSESNGQDKSTYTIAVARDNNDQLSIHFGHARQFEIYQYQLSNSTFSLIERRNVDLYCNGANDCDENIDTKDAIIEAVSDCDYILCARIGISPWKMLEQRGVTPVVDYAYQNVSDALSKLAQQLENTVEPEAEYDTCHNE